MASVRAQLNEGKFVVVNQGNEAVFTFPTWLHIDNETLNNEELLVAHCKKYNVLHKLLHTGLQQEVINCRAISRIVNKAGKAVAYTAELVEKIQEKLNDYLSAFMPAPAEPKKTKQQILDEKWSDMKQALRSNGLTKPMIAAMKVNFFK